MKENMENIEMIFSVEPFFLSAIPFGLVWCIDRGIRDFSFVRDFNATKMSTKTIIDSLPESVLIRNDMNRKLDKTGIKKVESKCVNQFVKTIKESVPHFDLTYFYNNFKAYSINQQPSVLSSGRPVHGYYNIFSKKIFINSDKLIDTIFHELFHEASSTILGDLAICGFQRTKYVSGTNKSKIEYSIGLGINEGYTSLLTERYFSRGNRTLSMVFTQTIENMLGREFMEHAYSKGDLRAIVDEMSKYISREEVIELLIKMDSFEYYIRKAKSPILKVRTVQFYKEAVLALAKFILSKVKRDLQNGVGEDVLNLDFETYTGLLNLEGKSKFLHYRINAFDLNKLSDSIIKTI